MKLRFLLTRTRSTRDAMPTSARTPLATAMTCSRLAIAVVAVGTCLLTTMPASAALVTFTGADPGVGAGGARPNSDAAAAAFQAAALSLSTITFESAPLGNFASLGVAPGVTASLLGTDSSGGILNINSITLGYNTTAAGSRFLEVRPEASESVTLASATFSFTSPIDAFGAYLTGLGTAAGALHVTFNDGSVQDITVTGSSSGGVQFFGFTDAGASISSVALELRNPSGFLSNRDLFGIDDVQYRASSAVPEPTTALFGLALVGFCTTARRRRAQAQA